MKTSENGFAESGSSPPRTIALTRGYFATVDAEDYERVSQYSWQADVKPNAVYATRAFRNSSGKKTTQYLHRFLLGISDSRIKVDHKDHNGLNCQKSNLRVATNSQNMQNLSKRTGTSRYKGVAWDQAKMRWRAQIVIRKKSKHLGYFMTEEEAARAYNQAAHVHFGEFACLNAVSIRVMLSDVSAEGLQRTRIRTDAPSLPNYGPIAASSGAWSSHV